MTAKWSQVFFFRFGTIISTKAILDKNTNKCKGKSLSLFADIHFSKKVTFFCNILLTNAKCFYKKKIGEILELFSFYLAYY